MPRAEMGAEPENLRRSPKRSLLRKEIRNYAGFLGLFLEELQVPPAICVRLVGIYYVSFVLAPSGGFGRTQES